ncbi:EamA family transporter [Cellulomonas soli]|uniref:Membrane protein n=1 Tax=Cellulomonas soli TaxID=931535 RepID=A0A512PEY9_9CELL|nr:O-acetylserine/cysteine efflux transporter [Cellulomonas soli]GEP69743.1 membrane protein [Cellulomonas soli]
MPLRDRLLAVLVAGCWGLNFLAIHLSLAQFPPFFLVALRFALIAVPTVLLVPRPDVAWRWILGYGFGFGVLQFVFLYLAMDTGMPTGLASLVLQASAPFTVLLAGLWLHERLHARQAAGIALAVLGLGGIAVHRAQLDGGATFLPVLLTLCGGLGWALGSLANRQARATEPFRLTLWMSVVPPLPMLALSLATEGPSAIVGSLSGLGSRQGLLAVAGLLYTVLVATLLGSGLWTTLMARHPSSTVAPFSMLVPVVGIGTSWLLLREPTPVVEIVLGSLVVAGVLLGSRPARSRPAEPRPARSRSAQSRSAGRTSAVAIPATPSPRPVSPSPSDVVAETLTGAPAAAESTLSASDRR